MRISDWSSDVCSSDLVGAGSRRPNARASTRRSGHPQFSAKRVEQRTARIQTGIAGSHGICQDPLHPLEVRDPLTHFPEMRGRDLAHVGAAAFADNRESEQRAHLLQGESQLPRAAHEAEASHVLPRITAIAAPARSEEHTSELQSLMRISYAVFCLNKKKKKTQT